MRNVYVAGASLDTNTNKLEMMIQKFNFAGDLLWETTYGGALTDDDMAADLFIDDNHNVYVTGAVAENAQNHYDLAVVKFSSSGTLQWEYFYNYGGSPIPYDAGTAITGDNNDHIYVTGSSAGNNTNSDYVIIKLEAGNGSEVWTQRYDYAGFDDVPAKIKVYNNQEIVVSGGSQIDENPAVWEMATIELEPNGQIINDFRTGESVTGGISEVYDMTVDGSGNYYIVGAKKNSSTDYDIILYKLDGQLNLVWEETYDGYGNEDRGKGIKVDNQGNVYVAGFVTTQNEGKNYSLLKYNANGNLAWTREYNGMASLDDEAVQLVISDNNKIFVTGSAVHENNSDFVTLGYDENGKLFNEISYDGETSIDDTPTHMGIDLDGNIIVAGQSQISGSNFENVTVKYTIHEKSLDFSNGINIPNELIIRFDTSAIIYQSIDKEKFIAGSMQDFVKEEVLDTLFQKTGFDWRRLETYKIFKGISTADSISVTRLGETRRIDDFWATLSVFIPENENEAEVIDSLSTIYPIIHFSHVNGLIEKHSTPNDTLISSDEQASLVSTSTYQNANIFAENAWDIEVGQWSTKVGVFDDPIYWSHEDFGDGSYSGSKITGGWDYFNEGSISGINNPSSSHGTSAAGIIGALRNNGKGIAGIAGGDVDDENNLGCQLFSMGIFDGGQFSTISKASEAIVEGAVQTSGYGFGLDVQNHSWGGSQPYPIMQNALNTAWKEHSTFVASRGNDGNTSLNYPACYNDLMVLNTGASGTDGNRLDDAVYNNGDNWWASSYAGDVDFIAPGTTELITATINPNAPYNYPNNCSSSLYPDYQCFNGTSAAAPHVAGVAALMKSRHNTNNGAPNNLTTEDIENILEKNALGYPNYQTETGWGLINAGAALEQVDYPEYYVKHDNQLSNTPNNAILTQQNVVISILNSQTASDANLAAGTYIASQYQLNWTMVEILPTNQQIIDWWPLAVKSSGISSSNIVSGDYWVDAAANISGNSISIEATTYCWVAHNAVGSGQIVNKFIPFDAPQCEFHYSLHINNTTLNTKEHTLSKTLNLYPNPTDGLVNIDFELESSGNVAMEVYDMQGVKIATPLIGDRSKGKHTISVNTSHLSSGMYIIKINYSDQMITKKFIKK